jgi:AcrR family transcriptional regulator
VSRPTTHDTDEILDAARELLLTRGPRATGVAAIAELSGAPVGSIYHRFGSRDALLAEVWLRALERFQQSFLAAAEDGDPLRACAEMAASVVRFARSHPADSSVLLSTREADLLDGEPAAELQARRAAINAPLTAALRHLARAHYGKADRRSVELVCFAVVDLPAGALRRHASSAQTLPAWLEDEVAAAAVRVLGGVA